jgi:hypothetical protein
VVARHGQHPRTVRELPADMDPIDLASDLRLAREEAEALAGELNRAGRGDKVQPSG